MAQGLLCVIQRPVCGYIFLINICCISMTRECHMNPSALLQKLETRSPGPCYSRCMAKSSYFTHVLILTVSTQRRRPLYGSNSGGPYCCRVSAQSTPDCPPSKTGSDLQGPTRDFPGTSCHHHPEMFSILDPVDPTIRDVQVPDIAL